MPDHVRFTVEGAVATIAIDRPPMNALSLAVQREIADAAGAVAAMREINAVVIHGLPKALAAGADVKEMAGMTYADMAHVSPGLQSAFSAVAAIPQPTIAAITGYALGGGLELALCCDLRIAGEGAQLGQPEIALGIIPGAGGTQRLPRLIGVSRAKDLVFSGRFLASAEALALGLVDRVVPDSRVVEEARAWAETLARGPGLALRAAKRAIDAGMNGDLATGLEIERIAFTGLFATRDREIGMTSFVERGPGHAEFTGT